MLQEMSMALHFDVLKFSKFILIVHSAILLISSCILPYVEHEFEPMHSYTTSDHQPIELCGFHGIS